MFFKNTRFRTFLLATALSSQLLLSHPSYGGGEFSAEDHKTLITYALKRKGENAPQNKSGKKAINKKINTALDNIERSLGIYTVKNTDKLEIKQQFMRDLRVFADDGDLEKVLKAVMPAAKEGFLPGVYFASLCEQHLDHPEEELAYLSILAKNGDEDGISALLEASKEVSESNRRSVIAAFLLAEHYENTRDINGVLGCLDRLRRCEQTEYPHDLLNGFAFTMRGKYVAAWECYRQYEKTLGAVCSQRTKLLTNSHAILPLAISGHLKGEELTSGIRLLFDSCKKDKVLRGALESQAKTQPVAAYLCGRYIVETLPRDTCVKAYKKHKQTKRSDLIKLAFRHFVFALSRDVRSAKEHLDQLLGSEKALQLNAITLEKLEEYELGKYFQENFKKTEVLTVQPKATETLQPQTQVLIPVDQVEALTTPVESLISMMALDTPQGKVWITHNFSPNTEEAPSYKFARDLEQHRQWSNVCSVYFAGARHYQHAPCLSRLIELSEKNIAPALLNLGVYYYELKETEKAETIWKKLLVLNDPVCNPILFFNFGQLEEDKMNIQAAKEWYLKAAELCYMDAYVRIGQILLKHEKDQARGYLENVLTVLPGLHDLWFLLGAVNLQEGHNIDAMEVLIIASTLGSRKVIPFLTSIYKEKSDSFISLYIGINNLILKSYKEAEKYLLISLSYSDENQSTALYHLILNSLATYNKDKALDYCRKASVNKNFQFVEVLGNYINEAKNVKIEKMDKIAEIAEYILKTLRESGELVE